MLNFREEFGVVEGCWELFCCSELCGEVLKVVGTC